MGHVAEVALQALERSNPHIQTSAVAAKWDCERQQSKGHGVWLMVRKRNATRKNTTAYHAMLLALQKLTPVVAVVAAELSFPLPIQKQTIHRQGSEQ